MKLLMRSAETSSPQDNSSSRATIPKDAFAVFLRLMGGLWNHLFITLGIVLCSSSYVLAQGVPNMAWSCGRYDSQLNLPPHMEYAISDSEQFINEWTDRKAEAHVVFSLKGFTYDDQGKITETETFVRPLADAQAHISATHSGYGGTNNAGSYIGAVAYHYGRLNAKPGAPAGATIPLRIRLLGHASASSSRLDAEWESGATAYSTFRCGPTDVSLQVIANASGPTYAEYDQTITCDVHVGDVFECSVHASAYAAVMLTYSNEHGTGEAQAIADPQVEIDPSYAFKDYFTFEFSTGLVFKLDHLDLELQSVTTDTVASVWNYQYLIQVPTNYPQGGETVWFARVYGTNGISTNGVSWRVNTNDTRHVSLTVTNSIQGEVVLFAAYSKTNDFTLVANPVVVRPYPTGTALSGIDMTPPFAVLSTGAVLETFVWGVYSNGVRTLLYLPSGQASYTSSNTNVASVNTNGIVTMLSAGSTTIAASYNGFAASMVVSSAATGGVSSIGVSGDLAFGPVDVGATATRTMTITNGGNSHLNVTNIIYPASFSGNWAGILPSGSFTNVNVTFTPAAVTSYVGTVTVQSDATGGSNTIAVSGTGTAPVRVIGVSGGLANGLVEVGFTAVRTLTLTNSGTSMLTVTNISYPSGFTGDWAGTVPAGGSTNVTVTFTPTTAMAYGGTATVSSDATSGTNTISISGTGWTNFALLHQFFGGANDGRYPRGSLSLIDGTLYGMTLNGGDVGYGRDNGVIFKVNVDGTGYSIPHMFGGAMSDAGSPYGSLIRSGSTLYGMTEGGGDGNGTIIKIDTNGTGYTILRRFQGGANDSRWPYGSLTLAGSTLYGMTDSGGASDNGVVFSVNTNGTSYTNIHSFAGFPTDGYSARGSLILTGTVLYGMAYYGGTSGGGMIFRMNTDGSNYTNLHNFHNSAFGREPMGSLIMSSASLYGMTSAGGVSNVGCVFKMNTDGSAYTNIHYFTGGANDGATPYGSLIAWGTNLYGMASAGGTPGGGVIFRIGMNGSGYTNLHVFANQPTDGGGPWGDLTLSGSYLYGMTEFGGVSNRGVIFVLSLSSPPSGYGAWAAQITNGLTNYNQCATGDGYPNLLKYATGSSPTNSDSLAVLNYTRTNGIFAVVFHRNTNAVDVSLSVEGVYSLTNTAPWNGIVTNQNGSWGGATNVSESGVGTPVTVTALDTVPTATNRFFRLRVTLP